MHKLVIVLVDETYEELVMSARNGQKICKWIISQNPEDSNSIALLSSGSKHFL